MSVDLTELIGEILRDSREMVLATTGEGGPWAASLVFGHNENYNLYWTSQDDSRHSLDLAKNPQAAVVINKEPTNGDGDKGLQLEGKAYKLTNETEILGAAREYYAKRGALELPDTVEEIEPFSPGASWFVFKPSKIYIFYGPLFGFERKELVP